MDKAILNKWIEKMWDSATNKECLELIEDMRGLGLEEEANAYSGFLANDSGEAMKDLESAQMASFQNPFAA